MAARCWEVVLSGNGCGGGVRVEAISMFPSWIHGILERSCEDMMQYEGVD